MLILYIKHCVEDNCRLLTKTVFSGILPLFNCNSQSILEEIKNFYTTRNIDMQRMVMFVTSDGAVVMLGKRTGVAKLLQSFISHLVEQHYVAHQEELGTDDSWSKVSLIQDIEILVRTTRTTLSRSSVKKQGLVAIAQASGQNIITFKAIYEVRWLSCHFAIEAFVSNYDVLLEFCKEEGICDPVTVLCVTKLESLQISLIVFSGTEILLGNGCVKYAEVFFATCFIALSYFFLEALPIVRCALGLRIIIALNCPAHPQIKRLIRFHCAAN